MSIAKTAIHVAKVALSILCLFVVIGILFAFAMLFIIATHPSKSIPVNPLSASDIDVAQLFTLTNQDRSAAGVSHLTLDQKLNASAAVRCHDMATKQYYDHNAPDGTPWYSAIKAQEPYAFAAENIAVYWSGTSAQRVNQDWLNSAGHRANIENSKYTNAGFSACIGTYKNQKALFVVEHFIQPSL